MKLRIRDNSIRLRLTQSEVQTLRDTGCHASKTVFPDGRVFTYVIEATASSDEMAACFGESRIAVRVPEAKLRSWADSMDVSMSGDEILPGGEQLKILVEKDFACLAPREGEDESDMFAHPDAGTETC